MEQRYHGTNGFGTLEEFLFLSAILAAPMHRSPLFSPCIEKGAHILIVSGEETEEKYISIRPIKKKTEKFDKVA